MPGMEDFANRLRETRGSGGGADGAGRRLKRLPLGTAFPLLQRTKENADGVGRRDFGSRRVAAEPAAQTSARQKLWRWSEKQDVQCLIPVWFWEGEIRGLRSFRGAGLSPAGFESAQIDNCTGNVHNRTGFCGRQVCSRRGRSPSREWGLNTLSFSPLPARIVPLRLWEGNPPANTRQYPFETGGCP